MLKILPLFFGLLQAEEVIPYASSSGVYLQSVIKSILIIVLLLAGMYYWYKKILPKLGTTGNNLTQHLAIKERLVIEPGTTAYVMQIKDENKLLLISNKHASMQDLPKLKYSELPKKDFQGYLADFLQTKDNQKVNQKGKKSNVKK